jgi:hypothetical protein
MKITNIPVSWYMWQGIQPPRCIVHKKPLPSSEKKIEKHLIVEPIEAYNKQGEKHSTFLFQRYYITHDEEDGNHHRDVKLGKHINKHV